MKTKHIDLFSYTKAEYCKRFEREKQVYWDYGRKEAFPLWMEFVNYQRWYAPDAYYHHEHPTTWGVELPIAGNLQVSIDNGEPITIEPGFFLLYPSALSNTIRTGPAGFCNKFSFGFSGSFLTSFMANSTMRPVRAIKLPDKEKILPLISQICDLLEKKNIENAPKIAGLTLELLLLLEHADKSPLPEPLGNAIYILESQISYPYKIYELEKELNISKSNLLALFREHFQMTPKQFYRNLKMKHAAHLLSTSKLSIKDISVGVGYTDQLIFSHEFKKQYNASPLAFRKNQNKKA